MVTLADSDVAIADLNDSIEQTPVPTSIPVSSQEDVPSGIDGYSNIPSEVADIGDLESEIPGLDSFVHIDTLPEPMIASSLVSVSTELDEASQEQVTTSLGRSSMEIIPSMSTDRSEELSPKAGLTDATSVNNSSANCVGFSSQLVLPKMLAPVISLADEQKDNLQKSAFMRIIDAYKQIVVAGGSQVRSAVLACLAVEV